MDTQSPMGSEEVAKLKKNAKTLFTIAGALLALIIIIGIVGHAPTWLVLLFIIVLGLGAFEHRKAMTSAAPMAASATVVDAQATPVEQTEPAEAPVTPPVDPLEPTV